MATESELTRRLCEGLEKRGCLVLAVVGGKMQAPGWPDRFVSCPSDYRWHGWIEFKGPHGKLSGAQHRIVGGIRKRGGQAVVFRHGHNTLEDETGSVLATSDGTAEGLLKCLQKLSSSV